MGLSEAESSFVAKRSRLNRHWPWAGSILLVLIIALAGWLWVSVPHLVNPWAATAGLRSGTLPDSTITLMAAILPIVMLTFLVFVVIMVVLMFVAFANERRLIRLINRHLASPQGEAGGPTQ